MQVLPLPGIHGHTIELDLCFHCQGMWIDPQENLKLSPAAVADLFRLLHEQRTAAHLPLAAVVQCPRCNGTLTQGFDVVRSGRYITYRCARGHGRFSAFSSFMIEKGFVRLMTRPEIDDLARRVAVIQCSSCGAPGGTPAALGASPVRTTGSVRARGSRCGTTESRARVYGCWGSLNRA